MQPLLDWVSANPTWSGIIVFFISLSESLAIIGLVVPGVVLMTAIGAMMGAGILPFWATLIWAILGAIAGDGISYWLGYHYHQHLRDFWPFRQFPQLLARGEAFFKSHGGKSIIFGRFVGPVRPMIPVIAGMMDMTPKKFLFFNIVSAIAWAPLYSLPGILIGASLGALSPEVARRVVLLILLLLLVLWIIYVFLIKLGMWIKTLISRSLQNMWKSFESSPRMGWVHKALATKIGSEEGQLGLILLFLGTLLAFVYITWSVMLEEGIALWNEPVYQALRALYLEQLVDGTALLTGLGTASVLLPVAFVIGLWLFWKKRYIEMFCWLGTIGIGEFVGYGLKDIVAMPRPEGLIYLTTEYSFPSGHALTAVLVYGLAAGFIHNALDREHRWIPWAISLPLIFLIAVSRVYLGMHWFTDVIGGLAWGTACVALGLFFYRRYVHTPLAPRLILIPGLLALVLTYAIFAFHSFPKQRLSLIRQWTVQEISNKSWWQGSEETNPLHRSGAFKRIATIFDIEWLGNITDLEDILQKNGFQLAPPLTLQTWLMTLVSQPKAGQLPVLPKFHLDRLPVLVMIKPNDDNERYVVQFWRSDLVDEDDNELWVGTVRLEAAKHPVPLVTLFMESSKTEEAVNKLSTLLNTGNIEKKSISVPGSPQKIILVRKKQVPR